MNHDDQLRQLLNELADDAPLALGRKEAVMSRVSRRVQRQAAVRGAAALVVAVGLGLGAMGTVQHLQTTASDGHAGDSLVSEPTHAAEPTDAAGTPGPARSAEPHPTQTGPTVVEPTHQASHEPTATPSAESTAASGPLTVRAVMEPGTVAAGSTSTAYVTARDGEGRLLAVDIDWGDGSAPFHFSPGDVACPRTTHLDGRFTHTYATGRSTPYPVHVTVTSGDCAPTETKTVETHVTVTGGDPSPSPTMTNGPATPVPGATQTTGDNPAYVYLHVTGSDQDGFVRRISVDWGDGTSSLVGEWSTSSCTNADGTTHPVASQQGGNVNHQYSTAGQHEVTLHVQSVACDGSHEQSGTSTVTVNQATG